MKTLIPFSFHSNFELQRPEAECEEKRWLTIFLFLFFLSFISLSLLSNFELQRSNIIIVFWHQCNTTLHKKTIKLVHTVMFSANYLHNLYVYLFQSIFALSVTYK